MNTNESIQPKFLFISWGFWQTTELPHPSPCRIPDLPLSRISWKDVERTGEHPQTPSVQVLLIELNIKKTCVIGFGREYHQLTNFRKKFSTVFLINE